MKINEKLSIALKQYGVEVVFGIVGIPIVEVAESFVEHGIRFIGCRNEQSCSYAASAYGYLTGKPGVLLVVGGPGVIHALAGVYNSFVNKWPLLVLAGSSENEYYEGFQELDQLSVMSRWCKFYGRINTGNLSHLVYTAMKTSMLQNAVTYIDIPGGLIEEKAKSSDELPKKMEIAHIRCGPDIQRVKEVATIMQSGKKILVVVGRGSANYPAEVRAFLEKYQLPFLPTPMAKGIVPDTHELNVNGARSLALKSAEVVLILGARLNWILHFGLEPKWSDDACFIQVDRDLSALGTNNPRGVNFSVHSDIGLFIEACDNVLPKTWKNDGVDEKILSKIHSNGKAMKEKEIIPEGSALRYHGVYAKLREFIDDKSTIMVLEGANTMDIARVSFPTSYQKHRLDAGTSATMGVGIGYAMAAKVANPSKFVVALEGDSAFGFSAMELETIARNKLGIVVVVMNNGGIYMGNTNKRIERTTDLLPECRYDILAQGLGCNGVLIRTLDELGNEFPKALQNSAKGITTVLNVLIEPGKTSKVSFGWRVKSNM
ncbi:putative indolepyruvate decarboxylase family protein Ecym_1360 [Eremothecium cymbalariae DBVPG|uniref:2-hydroxyacyl-CoA lyase n=1 Tax=Eremothecium cymbalariae (strain CBS 270.75 / DBVPG 7215 / KCTC 17166 / NRRL Y-17582) TaxID=931890 RepID=G8JNC9_ERECY|nr:hypothetical protein Ecym_1360 [Eremothecium cymbalariae DBVPG\